VGTVCFGLATKEADYQSDTQHFEGDREAVRRQAVAYALSRLLYVLGHD
jgi:nicotinamide-nucleotide amidase